MELDGNTIAMLINLAGEILVPVIGFAIVILARKWFKVDMTQKQQQSLHHIIYQATNYAEQRYRKSVKSTPEFAMEDKSNRLDWAVKFAVRMMNDQGLPNLITSELIDLIEAEVGAKNGYKRVVAVVPEPAKKKTTKKKSVKKTTKKTAKGKK